MFNVTGSEMCPVCLEGDSNLIGRAWKRVESTLGLTEVHNEALGQALLTKTTFSKKELDAFLLRPDHTVATLKYTDCIKVQTRCLDTDGHRTNQYFVPINTHESLFYDALVKSLTPREITAHLSAMKVVSVILYEFQYPPFIDSVLATIVPALLANSKAAPRMSSLQQHNNSGWVLLLNIYRAFAASPDDRTLFDRLVPSYTLVEKLWHEEIPGKSDLYGDAPTKRKREDSEFGNYLRQSDSYSHHVYQYFFAAPPESGMEFPNNFDNLNLQYLTDRIKMKYIDVCQGRINCKISVGNLLHASLPRNLIREDQCVYTPVCRNGHQVCAECALNLKMDKHGVQKCPLCKTQMDITTIDSDKDLIAAEMVVGPSLYIKFFKFPLPFYVTVTNCLFSRRHPFMQNIPAPYRQSANEFHNSLTDDDEAPYILAGKKINGAALMNSFDVQCQEDAKVSVRLYTARTVMASGYTVSLVKRYAVTVEHKQKHVDFSPQFVDNVYKNVLVPEPVTETLKLDGNCCVILDETAMGFQRWDTSLDLVFHGPDGSVLQTAAINIDRCLERDMGVCNEEITAERACVLDCANHKSDLIDQKLLGDVYNARGQRVPL